MNNNEFGEFLFAVQRCLNISWYFFYLSCSFDEMGRYDIPASIDYTLKVTQQEKLYYVGFSMGNAAVYITLHYHPHYNQKVRTYMNFLLTWTLMIDEWLLYAGSSIGWLSLLGLVLWVWNLLPLFFYKWKMYHTKFLWISHQWVYRLWKLILKAISKKGIT